MSDSEKPTTIMDDLSAALAELADAVRRMDVETTVLVETADLDGELRDLGQGGGT